eukprot:3059811-Rhodomonas_salina.1
MDHASGRCLRCGRDSHWAAQCFAIKHLNGQVIRDEPQRQQEEQRERVCKRSGPASYTSGNGGHGAPARKRARYGNDREHDEAGRYSDYDDYVGSSEYDDDCSDDDSEGCDNDREGYDNEW